MRRAVVLAAVLGLVTALGVRAEQEEPVVYTNADLPPADASPQPAPASSKPASPSTKPAPPSSRTAPVPPASSVPRSATTIPLEIPSYAAFRDRNGHGEGWWRHRACQLEAQVLLARYEAQKAHVARRRGLVLVDPSVGEKARIATARLKEVEAEQAGLPEELRQAGGLPGWLRGGGTCLEGEPLPAPGQDPATFGDGVHLSWKPSPQASFYVVEVQCIDCCGFVGECDVRSHDVTSTSLDVPFEADRSGRWRVQALDGSGTPGDWSDWQIFERPGR